MLTRVSTTVIAITVGALVLFGYFIPAFTPFQTILLNWAIILAGAATIVGILNIIRVHGDKVTRREKGSGYSILLVLSLLAVFLLGMAAGMAKLPQAKALMAPFAGIMDGAMGIVMNGIIIPVESMLMGLLVISLLYAAIRLLRRRADVTSITFLVIAVVVMLGMALPLGSIPIIISRWVTQVLALGGARGILIGVALGALTTGLRVLFGTDRPYGGN
jgi:hypothetical protein